MRKIGIIVGLLWSVHLLGNFSSQGLSYYFAPEYHYSLIEEDTTEAGDTKRVLFFFGGQFAGSTTIAPMVGYEFHFSEKVTLRTSLTTGLDLRWSPPSFEVIPKVRLNYFCTDWLSFTAGGGGELRFNPWYLNDPDSHDFPFICTFGNCPVTKYQFYLDVGPQFSLLRSRQLQLIPLFTYFLPSKKYVLDYLGPLFTIEFNYKLK